VSILYSLYQEDVIEKLTAVREYQLQIKREAMSDQFLSYSDEYVEVLKMLSPREIEVLEKVAEGYTSPEIGEELHISKQTVKKHRENIRGKLELQGYRGLFQWCRKHVPA